MLAITTHIADVAAVADDDELVQVTASVTVNGVSRATSWSAVARHTAAGIDGLIPAGDSYDCWVDGALALEIGTDAAVSIGAQVLAMAPLVATDAGMVVR